MLLPLALDNVNVTMQNAAVEDDGVMLTCPLAVIRYVAELESP